MRTTLFFLASLCAALAFVLVPTCNAASAAINIYVSPNGADGADGLTPETLPGTGTGPVRTIEGAKLLVRKMRAQPTDQKVPITVLVRGGRYELARPLTFGPEDSGSADAPTVYRSYPGEVARIGGGHRIRGWHRLNESLWSAFYRDPLSPNGCPSQIFINGERRSRLRLPANGTLQIARIADKSTEGVQPNDRFYANRADLPAHMEVNDDTEVVVFDAWTASRMRLKSYDGVSGLLSLSGKFAGHGIHPDMTVGLPYYIENFRGDPLQDKTWQCDERSGQIRYRSARDEDLETAEVVAPHLGTLISLQGRPDQPVHDIHFENLYFEHTSWYLPQSGWAAMQAEVGLPGAVEMRNATSISFKQFALVHAGASGIRIRENCSDITISGGELRDLGGSGIAIGSEQRRPEKGTPWESGETSSAPTRHILVRDNLIASVGRIHWAAVGVWVGHADHVRIERNEIRDLYYSGISVGWTWGFGETLSHDNEISGNLIYDFGQGILSDFAGIYVLGRQTNSVVENNIIRDGKARAYGGHGLYGDSGTSAFTFRDNVVVGVSHAGIHIHFGTDLLFERNFLFDYGEAGVRCTRPSKGRSVVFRDNLLQSSTAPPFFGVCNDRSYIFEQNLIRRDAGEKSRTGFPRDAQEAVEWMSPKAGRLSQIRFTLGMRDSPRALP